MYPAEPARPVSDDVFLKFQYDERDIVNAMRLRLSGRLRLEMLLVGLAGVGVALARAFGHGWTWPASIAALCVALLYAVIRAVMLAPPGMVGETFEARRERPGTPEGFRDTTMSIDASDDGITVTLGPRQANIRWSRCVRLDSDARCYILYHGRRGFLVVPRRSFRTEKRDAAFRELVGRFVGAGPAA